MLRELRSLARRALASRRFNPSSARPDRDRPTQLCRGRNRSAVCAGAIVAVCALGPATSGDTHAEGRSIPSFETLNLQAWSPRNDFRPIADLGAGNGSAFGFNEGFIRGYLLAQGVKCDDCAGNAPPIALEVAESYLNLLKTHGVSVARDIVSERFLEDQTTYTLIKTVLKEYQSRDFTLVLVIGRPTARPMGRCDGFAGDNAAADRTAYVYSAAIAQLILYLRDQPDVDRHWLATRVLVEPWNEFDGICNGEVGSPEKSARYQGVMQTVFDRVGIENEVLMPSIVNVYNHTDSDRKEKYGKNIAYIEEYYRIGGSGRPNVHFYYNPHRSDNIETLSTILVAEVAKIAQSAPEAYRGALLIGETGVSAPAAVAQCNNRSLEEDDRAALYRVFIDDLAGAKTARIVLFWRLLGLERLTKTPDDCDQFFGMTNNQWPFVRTEADARQTLKRTNFDLLSVMGRK